MPRDVAAGRARGEIECAVLAHQRVIVAPGEQRTNRETRVRRTVCELPAEQHDAAPTLDDYFVDDRDATRADVGPLRPRLMREIGQEVDPARVHDVRRVMLRAERKASGLRFHPRFETVHEDDAAGRGREWSEQQRVIAARAARRHGAGREAAQAVAFEPLVLQRGSVQQEVNACSLSFQPAFTVAASYGGPAHLRA